MQVFHHSPSSYLSISPGENVTLLAALSSTSASAPLGTVLVASVGLLALPSTLLSALMRGKGIFGTGTGTGTGTGADADIAPTPLRCGCRGIFAAIGFWVRAAPAPSPAPGPDLGPGADLGLDGIK